MLHAGVTRGHIRDSGGGRGVIVMDASSVTHRSLDTDVSGVDAEICEV